MLPRSILFLRRSVLLPIHRLRHKDNLSQEVSCSRQRTVLVRNLWQQYSKKEYGTHELTYFHSSSFSGRRGGICSTALPVAARKRTSQPGHHGYGPQTSYPSVYK